MRFEFLSLIEFQWACGTSGLVTIRRYNWKKKKKKKASLLRMKGCLTYQGAQNLFLLFYMHCRSPDFSYTSRIHLLPHVDARGEKLTCRLVARQFPNLQLCRTGHPHHFCTRRMADGAY